MSFLFGGGPSGRERDPELAAARRRNQARIDRDIGNEAALARGDTPRYRRPGLWLVVFVVVIAAIAAFRATTTKSPTTVARSCTTPNVAVGSDTALPADAVEFTATGPVATYVFGIDARIGTDAAGRPAVVGSDVTEPPRAFRMDNCLVSGQVTAPTHLGRYSARLFRATATGYVQVAQATLTVRAH